MISLTNMSHAALSVTSEVVDWVWPISMSAMCVAVPLCQFTKMAPSSDSIALARTFLIVVHFT